MQGAKWGTSEELLATLIEIADLGNRQFARAHLPKGKKPPPPIEVRRPTQPSKSKKRRMSTPEEMREFTERARV